MDLRKLYKQKIIDDILNCYEKAWSVLIHDNFGSEVLNQVFKKSDLLEFGVTGIFSIGDENEQWEIPAIYFVNCTKEIAKKINEDHKDKRYPIIQVFSLCEPVGLNPLIKCTVLKLEVRILEERIFRCDEKNLQCIANLLGGKFIISFIDISKNLAQQINETCKYEFPDELNSVFLLVLERSMDLYTPLMNFLTFRSVICEIGKVDTSDQYYKDIRDMHLSEVGDYLKCSAKILSENLKKLKKDNVDVETLSSMVLETPKNIETKKNVEKYAGYLTKCLNYIDTMKDHILLQQSIILGEDQDGNKQQINLDSFLSQLVSPVLTLEDKQGLMLLLKAKGIIFTESEKNILENNGFSRDDLEIRLITKNQIIRQETRTKPKDAFSRYTPIIKDVVESFATRKVTFQTLNIADIQVDSLRRSTMLSSNKPPRKVIVVYVKNGLSIEETSLAYKLSKDLGVEFLFGSDKVLTRKNFGEEFRKNKDLQERTFVETQ